MMLNLSFPCVYDHPRYKAGRRLIHDDMMMGLITIERAAFTAEMLSKSYFELTPYQLGILYQLRYIVYCLKNGHFYDKSEGYLI